MATRRIKEAEDAFANPASVDALRLEQLKRGLRETHERLNKLEEDIMPHIDPGDVAMAIEASERINDDFFAAMAKVEHVLHILLQLVDCHLAQLCQQLILLIGPNYLNSF